MDGDNRKLKQFDCGGGRVAVVRCADEDQLRKIDVAAGGFFVPNSEGKHDATLPHLIWALAHWGICELRGDWGTDVDGQPWRKAPSEMLGETYPLRLLERIEAGVVGEIAAFVAMGSAIQ